MKDNFQAIYTNANAYRLHADNLRWTLLGGFTALIAGLYSISLGRTESEVEISAFVYFVGFVISLAYLWILAVQNWFYNLFARFVDDCESRMVSNVPLQTLQSFARKQGAYITPFHPSFFMALLIVGTVSYVCLLLFLESVHVPYLTIVLNRLAGSWPVFFKIVGYFGYLSLLHLAFKNWNEWVYKPFIVKLSNMYQPTDQA